MKRPVTQASIHVSASPTATDKPRYNPPKLHIAADRFAFYGFKNEIINICFDPYYRSCTTRVLHTYTLPSYA